MADPEISKLDDSELERQTVDADNFPYQKKRAMLYWTGFAWARWNGATINSLVPAAYDYISLSPSSARPTTIVFKTGGAAGTTVATLTVAYDGATNDIVSVTKT